MRSLQGMEKCLNCFNWTFQTKVVANRTWTNHRQAICMDVNLWYDYDKFWRGKLFWLKCSMWMRSLQATKKAWIVKIVPSKQRLWLIELEQITAKPFAWMLIYDMITTNFDEENSFDFSVPCEWGHYKLYRNAWIVWIGPSKPRLWRTWNRTWTNHSQAICMDVNLWYDHDKLWRGKLFWFQCSMWMRSLQAIQKCVNCLNWTFQTKVMANRTWTNHSQAICMDVNLWYDHDKFWRGKHFWFQPSKWMRSLHAKRIELLELYLPNQGCG